MSIAKDLEMFLVKEQLTDYVKCASISTRQLGKSGMIKILLKEGEDVSLLFSRLEALEKETEGECLIAAGTIWLKGDAWISYECTVDFEGWELHIPPTIPEMLLQK